MSDIDLINKWAEKFKNKVINDDSLSADQERHVKSKISKPISIKSKVNNDVYYIIMDKCVHSEFYKVLNLINHQVTNFIKDDTKVNITDNDAVFNIRNGRNMSRVWQVTHDRLKMDIQEENLQSVYKAALKGLQG